MTPKLEMWFTSRPSCRNFLGIVLICSTVCAASWASLTSRERKRFGQSVIEEGLPLWLERRSVFAEPDPEWVISEAAVPRRNEHVGIEDVLVRQAMDQRGEEELERVKQLLIEKELQRDALKLQAPGVEDSIQLVRREDKPSPDGLGQLGGFRSHMNWQPITIGVICSVLGIMAVLGAAIYYQRVQMTKKRNQENDFCGIRQTKPSPTGSLLGDTTSVGLDGDRKLAHSAQMYHYQHQKQQMLAVERASDPAQASEEGSGESDVEEGDFTVYECPGLATTEQLEVENPLYEGDAAANGPSTNGSYGEIIGASDLEENSDSTPTTTKTEEH